MEATLPKTIVFGASGFIGRSLLQEYRRGDPHAVGTGRVAGRDLCAFDFADPDLSRLGGAEVGAEYGVVAAAMTNIARCEQDPEGAFVTNVVGPLALAEQLHARGIKPILFSSDYVFDGLSGEYGDDAATGPGTVYGRTKAELERRLPEVCGDDYLVIRLSKVFGLVRGDGTLLDEIAARLVQGLPVRAAVDQVFCPAWIDDVVRATLELQKVGACGIYNVCAAEAVSRFALAQRTAAALDVDLELVRPISLDDLGETFVRPKRTDMKCEKLWNILPTGFRSLDACLRELASHYSARKEVA